MLTPRGYESEKDLLDMQALLMAARSATGDWHYAHVGELMWNFFMVTCHLSVGFRIVNRYLDYVK